VSEFDLSQTLDSSSTPLTLDFIGLCIGVLSVILVILIVAVCKWSRCLCLKQNHNHYDQNGDLTSVIQPNTSTPYHNHQRHRSQNQRLSSCHHPGNVHPPVSTTRDGLLSPQTSYNGSHPNDVKASRVTIRTLPIQNSQQLVPRLSISSQVSNSSITHNVYSIKQ